MTSRPTIRRARSVLVIERVSTPEAVLTPRRRTVTRSAICDNFVQLVADENDRFSLGNHCAQGVKKFVHFGGGQDGGRFIHDQDVRAAVQHFENFNALLLAHRKLPDVRAWVDLQAKALAQFGDFLLVFGRSA